MVYCIRLIVNAAIYALAKQAGACMNGLRSTIGLYGFRELSRFWINSAVSANKTWLIRSGRRLSLLTDTLTGTLVELKRLLAQDITITILTMTVELRFRKRGCLRSDDLAADRYHNGSLRKQFPPPPIMPTMPWIETHQR